MLPSIIGRLLVGDDDDGDGGVGDWIFTAWKSSDFGTNAFMDAFNIDVIMGVDAGED